MAKNLEQRVDELEKQIKILLSEKITKINKKLNIGDAFEMCGIEWKILDINEKGYACLVERLESKMQFDNSSNDWRNSELRKYLNGDFLKKLEKEVGEENIVEFERDLLSMDGQTEYGKCEDKVSLLNVDEYRKYRGLIPNVNDYWWWLISPWSTPCNDYKSTVAVVSPSGNIDNISYESNIGVRPFCIFSSTIFES